MPRYLKNFIGKTKELRRQGKTYSEIKAILKTNIPKSTLSSWFKDIRKPKQYLEKYWMNIINIPKEFFYKARVDPRTIGKPSIDKDYKGVLRVDYFDVKIQDEIATLVNMLYNQISSGPEV